MLIKNQREQHHVLNRKGDCWQWQAIGQCFERKQLQFLARYQYACQTCDSALSSPEHPKSQDVKDSANAKSPRGRSPSGRINRMPCKDHLKGTERIPLVKSGIPQSVRGTNLRKAANSGTSARLHTAGLRNNLAKRFKKEVVTKVHLLY